MAPYYRESWRVHPLRFGGVAILVLGTAVGTGALVGCVAELHALLGLGIALGAGLGLGWLLRRLLPSAHVRNTPLTCALGVTTGLVAAWAAGVAWLYRATGAAGDDLALLCLSPESLAWALPRLTPVGVVADVWAVPALRPWVWALGTLALGVPALLGAWSGARARVYCEGCGCPADEIVRLHCEPIADPAVYRGGLEAEHYDLLLKLRPGDPRDDRYSRLTLEDCSRCETHSYLTIETVVPGRFGKRSTPVVRRLALWRDVFGELERRVVGEWSQAHTELVDS